MEWDSVPKALVEIEGVVQINPVEQEVHGQEDDSEWLRKARIRYRKIAKLPSYVEIRNSNSFFSTVVLSKVTDHFNLYIVRTALFEAIDPVMYTCRQFLSLQTMYPILLIFGRS